MKTVDLEQELLSWRESRKTRAQAAGNNRRTVRVNGQEVVVVRRLKRPILAATIKR